MRQEYSVYRQMSLFININLQFTLKLENGKGKIKFFK